MRRRARWRPQLHTGRSGCSSWPILLRGRASVFGEGTGGAQGRTTPLVLLFVDVAAGEPLGEQLLGRGPGVPPPCSGRAAAVAVQQRPPRPVGAGTGFPCRARRPPSRASTGSAGARHVRRTAGGRSARTHRPGDPGGGRRRLPRLKTDCPVGRKHRRLPDRDTKAGQNWACRAADRAARPFPSADRVTEAEHRQRPRRRNRRVRPGRLTGHQRGSRALETEAQQ